MRVYLANHSSPPVHYLAGRYARIGWLLGPTSIKTTKPRPWLPLAFDNDAFSAYKNGTEWDEKAWFEMLDTIRDRGIKPEWVLVPDVVGDKDATHRNFRAYSGYLHGFKLAYAVQDGDVPQNIPSICEVIFVGGTLKWKWKTLSMWTNAFPRVHVGRVNRPGKLRACQSLGVESVDGTGWFRRPPEEWLGELEDFFLDKHENQLSLF